MKCSSQSDSFERKKNGLKTTTKKKRQPVPNNKLKIYGDKARIFCLNQSTHNPKQRNEIAWTIRSDHWPQQQQQQSLCIKNRKYAYGRGPFIHIFWKPFS